jgi:predicted dienelactone hydrolase
VDPLSWAVDEPGPYQAGYRSWEVEFTSLADGSIRTVKVNAWYPTEATTGDEVRYLETFLDPDSLGDAAVADAVHASGYPVHVYSHGDLGWGGASDFLVRYLASHGWVSVAPDHTGNTLLDGTETKPTALYVHRPQDTIAVLDALEALPDDDPLSSANTDDVLMSGHSLGSYPTWANLGATYDPLALEEQCPTLDDGGCTDQELDAFASGELDDPRVAAGITLAGAIRTGFFGSSGHTTVHGPMMLMSGTDDPDGTPDSWDGLSGIERSWVEIEGGCHQAFALGACANLETDLGYHIVDTYALAFGRAHVLGDDSVAGVLDGSETVATEAFLTLGD